MDCNIGKIWPGLLTSVLCCVLVYLWGVMGFSFLWVVIAWVGYIEHDTRRRQRQSDREDALALVTEGEEAYLKVLSLSMMIISEECSLGPGQAAGLGPVPPD